MLRIARAHFKTMEHLLAPAVDIKLLSKRQ